MIQRPKGTKDIYGIDQKIHSFIFILFEKIAKSYNFQKISTPIFESLELFRETSGETSDIVVKELYSFKDFSNRNLALRPEGTASVGRAIIENKLLLEKKFNKLFYIGPMFRYEKPQKGRMRQFDQIGVEFIGDNSIFSIVECIVMANDFLQKLNITDYVLKINNIGTKEERAIYQKELSLYFEKNKNSLSELSQSRINQNPLRILDDKIDSKKPVVLNAPKISDFLSQASKKSFDNLLSLLSTFKVAYEIDLCLVRGLDYYSNIVFEFESSAKILGSKSTIIGGGCYDNLIKDTNQNINGVGFAVGVERVFEIIKEQNIILEDQIDVYFMINNQEEFEILFPIILALRNQDMIVDFNKRFQKPTKLYLDAVYFKSKQIVYFDLLDHDSKNLITIKRMDENIKIKVDQTKLIDTILEGLKNEKNK